MVDYRNIGIQPTPQAATDSWDAFPLASATSAAATAPTAPASQSDPWAAYPLASQGGDGSQPGYAMDTIKGVGSGLAKGAAAVAGMPADLSTFFEHALNVVEQHARGEGDTEFAQRVAERKAKLKAMQSGLPSIAPPGSETIRHGIENVTGPLYEPQTMPGKFAGKVAEYVPGAIAGGASGIRGLINFAALPGMADEAAGEITKGTAYEQPARMAAAIATGGVAGVLNRPGKVETTLRGAMAPGVTQANIDQAGQLMQDAAQRGVQLTWAEALEQVAPGSGLTNMQRVLESTPGGREVLNPVMAQRPGQVDAAARQTFDTIAPPNAQPSTTGPAVRDAANSALGDVRQRINATAEPFYYGAEVVRLNPQEMARVRALPGYEQARDAVRNDPQLNRYVANLPEDSTGFLNEVKKQLDQQSQNAASRFAQNRNQQAAAGYGRDASAVRDSLVNADMGQPARNYETALNIESQGRQQFLQPLMDGPLGKIAQRDVGTRRAVEALFPENPLPNSEHEITTAVSALARRNQRVTRDLIRAHAEATFNEAAQNLQSGANQFGGAKFAARIAGNPQQRANLEAAVRASGPDGDRVWDGFNRFLDIVQATGTRQPIGSKTAFNALELKDMASGGKAAGAAKLAGSPGKWLTAIGDAWSRWQLGRNVDQLAEILVNPQSRNLLRTIASRPVGHGSGQSLASNIIMLTNTARQSGVKDAAYPGK